MKNSAQRFTVIPAFFLVVTLASSGCGSSTASDGSGSEIATSTVAGAATSSEGSMAMLFQTSTPKSLLASVMDHLLPYAQAATCASLFPGTCSGSSETYVFGGCTVGTNVTWSGNLVFTYTTGTCAASPANAAAGAVFTRTSGDPANPLVRTAGSTTVTTTTQDSSGFAAAKTGGITIACGIAGGSHASDACSASRTITINGVHLKGTGATPWDHTVSTDTPVTMTGSGATRSILGGVVRVQHNLAQFQSVTTINGPLGHTTGCCFPTSGSVTTAFSGGKLDGKSETLAFGSTCGQATLTDSNNKSNAMTLNHCL